MFLLHLILLFCCIFPHISHICKRTGQKFPEDGQIFYRRNNVKYAPNEGQWFFRDIPEKYSCNGGTKFLKESELVESGKYKWKWHDCKDGTAVFEWKGDGSSGWFETTTSCMEKTSGDPCSSRKTLKHSKSDIEQDVGEGEGGWYLYDIYIPPVCSSLRPIETHCNCGGTSVTYEYSQTIGISKTNGKNLGITGSIRSEIQIGIKATAKVGLPFVGEGSVEASATSTLGAEIGSSFLTSSSTTWNQETRRTIRIDIPGGKCTTLYQSVAYYGEYEVGGQRTVKKERGTGGFCKRK